MILFFFLQSICFRISNETEFFQEYESSDKNKSLFSYGHKVKKNIDFFYSFSITKNAPHKNFCFMYKLIPLLMKVSKLSPKHEFFSKYAGVRILDV